MGLFSSKDRSAEAMLNLQREQIATAKAEKDAKDQRILAAIGQIKGLFDPQPVMGTRQVQKTRQVADPNWNAAAAAGGGLGQTIGGASMQSGGSDSMTSYGGGFDPRFNQANPGFSGGYYRETGGEYGGNGMEWVSTGQQQTAPMIDQTYMADEQYDTGERTGGFDKLIQDYHDKYLGTLTGEVNDKAELVRKDLLFALDRAGLMGGTPVDEKLGLWDKQKKDALTAAGVQADSAAGDYEDRVNAEKESLISQVFATEGQGDTASIAAAATQALQNMPQPTQPAQIGFDLGNIGQTYAQGYGVGNANYWNQQRSLKPSSPTQGSGGYTVV